MVSFVIVSQEFFVPGTSCTPCSLVSLLQLYVHTKITFSFSDLQQLQLGSFSHLI